MATNRRIDYLQTSEIESIKLVSVDNSDFSEFDYRYKKYVDRDDTLKDTLLQERSYRNTDRDPSQVRTIIFTIKEFNKINNLSKLVSKSSWLTLLHTI